MVSVFSTCLVVGLLCSTGVARSQSGTPDTAGYAETGSAVDSDGDGVTDGRDGCPGSAAGYPVRDNGCALLDGVLSGVTFVEGTAELEPGAGAQLDSLARLLKQYPDARVDILAHTDSRGTVRDQAILARQRLKSVGTYLQKKGISGNRLVLRSFAGTRPLYRNDTPQGRKGNNRIEVIENLR